MALQECGSVIPVIPVIPPPPPLRHRHASIHPPLSSLSIFLVDADKRKHTAYIQKERQLRRRTTTHRLSPPRSTYERSRQYISLCVGVFDSFDSFDAVGGRFSSSGQEKEEEGGRERERERDERQREGETEREEERQTDRERERERVVFPG